MSVTGLFLVLFVTFHALMNAVALISFEAYDAICEFLGANWYALLGTLILAGGFAIHIIFAFIVQFWAKMQLPEMMGDHVMNGTHYLQATFSQLWVLPVYLIGFAALWFHISHGFWSAFQTLGTANDKWIPRWQCISKWWATIVFILFAVEACYFTWFFAL